MLRQRQQSASPSERLHRACPLPRTPESLAAAPEPTETRRSLPAQFLAVVSLSADALRRRQLVVRAPREQPGLHILTTDVVASSDLPVRLPNLRQHSFLVRIVRLDGIRDQEIGAAARRFGQAGQPPFYLRFQADAERSTTCVRHEYILTRQPKDSCQQPTTQDQRPT